MDGILELGALAIGDAWKAVATAAPAGEMIEAWAAVAAYTLLMVGVICHMRRHRPVDRAEWLHCLGYSVLVAKVLLYAVALSF
ncbi:MAG: hypothetical protein AAGI34_14165 [Pseudomonadota bacterium]